jgi:glycosyltransferase involved in cell wall biosynthesis
MKIVIIIPTYNEKENIGLLLDYFHDLLESHSWSTVKLDLYGLKFFYNE